MMDDLGDVLISSCRGLHQPRAEKRKGREEHGSAGRFNWLI